MPDPIQGINTSILVGVSPGQAGATNAANTAQTSGVSPDLAPANVAPPVDQADVAATQNLLTTIIQIANNAPAVDQAKVNALQQSIAAGTYQVDPVAIAKKLMEIDTGDSGGGGQ